MAGGWGFLADELDSSDPQEEPGVEQTGLGACRWRTPHGLTRVVDHTGTRDVPDDRSPGG